MLRFYLSNSLGIKVRSDTQQTKNFESPIKIPTFLHFWFKLIDVPLQKKEDKTGQGRISFLQHLDERVSFPDFVQRPFVFPSHSRGGLPSNYVV